MRVIAVAPKDAFAASGSAGSVHDAARRAPVIPTMDSSASDAAMAAPSGIPVYAVSGDAADEADGRDERVSVEAFDRGVDFYYRFLKTLLGSH